jgi:hypothetical protein
MLDSKMAIVLAPYSHGKLAGNALNDVRVVALHEVSASPDACLVVIGLLPPLPSEPEDDPFLTQLFEAFRTHPGPKLYINPSSADCTAARAYGFDARQQTLEDFVEADVASG